MHPQPRVRFVVLVCTRVFTAEAPETSGIPHAMVLRLTARSPRGPGFLAPVVPEKLASQELSASVGAPGPHAFAVRDCAARLASLPRPPHPASNVRDDREAPLLWERDEGKNTRFLIFRKRNICAWRTDYSNQLEPAHKIRFYAHAIFCPERRSRAATSRKIQLSRPTSGKSVRGSTERIRADVLRSRRVMTRVARMSAARCGERNESETPDSARISAAFHEGMSG